MNQPTPTEVNERWVKARTLHQLAHLYWYGGEIEDNVWTKHIKEIYEVVERLFREKV